MQDIHDLVNHILKKWYYFVIAGGVCALLGVFYYLTTPFSFDTTLGYRIRRNEQGRMFYTQDVAMHHSIITGGQEIEYLDEQERVNSHAVMREVIRQYGLQVEVQKKNKMRYVGLFPCQELKVEFLDKTMDELTVPIIVKITKQEQGYKLKIKCNRSKYTFRLPSLDQPVEFAPYGKVRFIDNGMEADCTYRMTIYSVNEAADIFCKAIKSDCVNDEISVMEIKTTSTMPARAELIMNSMVEEYNNQFRAEKAMLQQQIDTFLTTRIEQVMDEIEELESSSLSRQRKEMLLQGKRESLQFLISRQNDVAFAKVYHINPISVIEPAYTTTLPASPRLVYIAIFVLLMTFCIPLLIFYVQAILTAKID